MLIYLTWAGDTRETFALWQMASNELQGHLLHFSDNNVMCLFDFIMQNQNHFKQDFTQISLYLFFAPFLALSLTNDFQDTQNGTFLPLSSGLRSSFMGVFSSGNKPP